MELTTEKLIVTISGADANPGQARWAKVPLSEMDRHDGPAFGIASDLDPFTADWHQHRHHQLLFAIRGSMQLEVGQARWFLPPQRMAWIRGGTPHRVTAREPVQLRTVYMDPALTEGPPEACVVLEVGALAREMILECMRWGPDQDSCGRLPRACFAALAELVTEWCARPTDFQLPGARTRELARAMEYALANLDSDGGLEAAARAAHVSERTLARRFESETHMSWRQWLHRARMLRAMEALASPGASATQVALAVGFASQAAFTRAFTAFTGETPSAYRKRAT